MRRVTSPFDSNQHDCAIALLFPSSPELAKKTRDRLLLEGKQFHQHDTPRVWFW